MLIEDISHNHLRGHRRSFVKDSKKSSHFQIVPSVNNLNHVSLGGKLEVKHVTRSILHAQELHKRVNNSQTLKRTMRKPLRSEVDDYSLPVADIAKRSKKLLFVLPILALVIFAGASFFLFRSQKQVIAVETKVAEVAAAIDNGETPEGTDETPPTSLSAHIVAPDEPRFLRIPKFNVESRIVGLGIKPDGSLASPFNIFDTGWYTASSKPGKNGAMLLDGHVHGPSQPGVFYELKNLQNGDEVVVEAGNGKNYTYVVVGRDVTPYQETNMNKALVSVERGRPGLNLITCTGSYDDGSDIYEERLVIYTVLK